MSASITWTVVLPGDETCQPNPDTLQVIPPDETDPLTVGGSAGACATPGG